MDNIYLALNNQITDIYEWHVLIENIYLALKGQITNKYNHHGQYKNKIRCDKLKWKFKKVNSKTKITSIFFS